MNLDEFLSANRAMYETAMEPVAATDENLKVLWANSEALRRFPALSLPDGIGELLNQYDTNVLHGHLCSGHAFEAVKLSEPLCGVSIRLIPHLSGDALIGCQAFIRLDGPTQGTLPEGHSEDVVAAFSHEYRMPLTVIFSTLGLMARHLDDVEDSISKSYLRLITQNCYRILRLSNNLAEVSKYRAGIAKMNLRNGDLTAFITNLSEASTILTRSVGIPLEISVPKKRLITVFDPDRLSLAIFNLLSNSCKYTRDDNRIFLKLEDHGEQAVITVSDQGEGIRSEIVEKIFEPYFSQKTESALSGAGLGLSIVKFIITQHGGTIALHSHEGKGTTVALSLPIRFDESLPYSVAENSADYLADRFSTLYVEMSDVCGCPLP